MNLSDIRDIDITIKSAEDLSKEHRNDISGLDKGEGILSGEAVAGIPIFVKVRKRITAHGGIGFNPLDFLSEHTIEEAQKRRNRLLGNKTEEDPVVFEELDTASQYDIESQIGGFWGCVDVSESKDLFNTIERHRDQSVLEEGNVSNVSIEEKNSRADVISR